MFSACIGSRESNFDVDPAKKIFDRIVDEVCEINWRDKGQWVGDVVGPGGRVCEVYFSAWMASDSGFYGG